MTQKAAILNGTAWTDTAGEPVRAHGGWMLQENGWYYWFGENRREGKKVSCYRSKDLKHWEHRNDVLTLQSNVQPTYYRTSLELDPLRQADQGYGQGAVIERPKVLHNALTGKYVMWMHWENGRNYSDARCAVAVCDTVDGDYTYLGSFNPIGHMSRDCTVFVDDDGTAYFLSAARDNADLLMYRLSDDYLSIEEHVKTLWPGQYREAPALFKRRGVYFLLTSACTGWLPNQGAYAWSDSLTGRWSPLKPFGNGTTFDTQPAFVLPVYAADGRTADGEAAGYLYVGDRWDPSDYHRSSYVFLPLRFPDERSVRLEWADLVTFDPETGAIEAEGTDDRSRAYKRLKSCGFDTFAEAGEQGGVIGRTLAYASVGQQWVVEQAGEQPYVRFRSSLTGGYLAAAANVEGEEPAVRLAEAADAAWCVDWEIDGEADGGRVFLRSRSAGGVLTAREDGRLIVAERIEHDPRAGRDPQSFELLSVY